MANASNIKNATLGARFRSFFTTRDFIFHDGRDLRRFSIAGRTQAVLAGVAGIAIVFSSYGVSQAMVGVVSLSGIAGEATTPEAQMEKMRVQVEQMRSDVEAAKEAAKAHAARIEQRQAMITATAGGKVDRAKIMQQLPETNDKTSALTEEVLEPLRKLEARQVVLAAQARATGEARFEKTAAQMRRLGLDPNRYVTTVQGGMGGPFEEADGDEATASAEADAQFRSLFVTWRRLDTLEQTVISIPSMQPVENLQFTSSFGVRSDPFRGTAAMHAGVDIPGAIGTPIYATADGVVGRSGRYGGYGNLIEVNHGRGIQTRYGHLSKILVPANTRVKRGQLIGLMGSTGRSTGSHLHYEVRVDGKAVNPIPFLQDGEYLMAIQDRQAGAAVGGPRKAN
ncbi:M23 family metallopeptidase [Sphingomonas sp. G-3-2-10]|uniref:M23 family metallopeptidase n=1 Tax=Sphingomonas sp. G-3-2-10 TaxID=2728838 RepID=UPI00146B407C|nr:M23 family metallopeptidase [Sphingomonas sp. G-3-2-10]NML05520.1 M23 family metallopeptidase [Sphingomonas sp. G-3-2-10]